MLSVETVRRIVFGRVGVGVVHDAGLDDLARGRAATASALREIGAPPSEIPTGPDRAPVWPDGIVGSIAHTGDVGIAVAASSSTFRALGIDLESADRAIDARIARRIGTDDERLSFADPQSLLALFCAKEAAYKALAPLGAPRLGFKDVVYAPLADGMLLGRLAGDPPSNEVPRAFAARYVESEGFVIAAVQIDR